MISTMQQHKITIYSTTWCGFCKQAKEFFKSKGLDFTELDVEKDPKAAEAMVAKSKQQGVPVIDIDGTIIVGYDLPKINATLAAQP